MTGDPFDPTELEVAILAVYRGPLEGFISRRDSLAKQLRASKRRAEADRVKALRKPNRMAWALDQVVFEDAASVERLARAIQAGLGAHTEGVPARGAPDEVRAAVRGVAEAGARAAIRGGNPIDSAALVAAVRAVMGDADAFADFRAGRLVEIPEGGGLDMLAAGITAGPRSAAATEPATKSERREGEGAAARAELKGVETALAKARARAQAAERAVRSAQGKLEAAEEQLERARTQADERRAELDRARQDASTAATELADAERLLNETRDRLGT